MLPAGGSSAPIGWPITAIGLTLAGFTTGVQTVEFEIVHLAAFEVHDGKITQWRDYFDLQQFMSQLPASDG